MKPPKLKWQEVWIVKTWDVELVHGIGCFFKAISEGIFNQENSWLVFLNKNPIPLILNKYQVFTTYEEAYKELLKQKQEYLKFCSEQVLIYSKKVEELSK